MNDLSFEGYTGLLLRNHTAANDVILVIMLVLLSAFAWFFRKNVPLFGKMISNITAGEQRQSIFETTERDSFFFNTFMTFQALLLYSISLFCIAVRYNYIENPSVATTCFTISALFLILLVFFFFKKGIYAIFGYIFLEKSAYKMMFTNYQALFCSWSILLYMPILWMLLIKQLLLAPVILMIICHLAFRIGFILRFIYIFFNKNTSFLFLSLYLCGQEIIPLVFLYEGLTYIYKMIETNNIWQ